MQAYRLGAVQVESYSLFAGLAILAFAYLGGITSVWGAIIGGLMVGGGSGRPRPSATSPVTTSTPTSPIIGAIGLILTAILNPEGIATGTALTVKALWAKATRSGAGRGAAPSTAPSEPHVGGRGVTVTLLQTTDLTVTFGGLHANDDVNITVDAADLRRPDRAERRRQDDVHRRHHRLRLVAPARITLDGEDLAR